MSASAPLIFPGQFTSVKDGIYALEKVHKCAPPRLLRRKVSSLIPGQFDMLSILSEKRSSVTDFPKSVQDGIYALEKVHKCAPPRLWRRKVSSFPGQFDMVSVRPGKPACAPSRPSGQKLRPQFCLWNSSKVHPIRWPFLVLVGFCYQWVNDTFQSCSYTKIQKREKIQTRTRLGGRWFNMAIQNVRIFEVKQQNNS